MDEEDGVGVHRRAARVVVGGVAREPQLEDGVPDFVTRLQDGFGRCGEAEDEGKECEGLRLEAHAEFLVGEQKSNFEKNYNI